MRSMDPRSCSLADVGVEVTVVLGVPRRLSATQVRRLAELGLRPGARIGVLHRTPGGGRIVAVGASRIALDRATLGAIPVVDVAELW